MRYLNWIKFIKTKKISSKQINRQLQQLVLDENKVKENQLFLVKFQLFIFRRGTQLGVFYVYASNTVPACKYIKHEDAHGDDKIGLLRSKHG